MDRREYYDAYFMWLSGLVRSKNSDRYTLLLSKLHGMDFIWIHRMDSNRYEDGIYMRREYLGELDRSDIPCSVLEMMVALALRMDREIIGESSKDEPAPIFWEMITNLGLKRFTDSRYKRQPVEEIVLRWLTRQFDRDGSGSIFPIEKAKKDQRKLEIWDQMHAYLSVTRG